MKSQKLTQQELIVEDLDAGKILLSRYQRQFIRPFLSQECSLGEAAKLLGVKTNTMYYYVKKLLNANLIEQAREETVKGRNIVFYRAVSDTFLVPFSGTAYTTFSELLYEIANPDTFTKNIAKVLEEMTPSWGIRLSEEKVEIVPIRLDNEVNPMHLEQLLQIDTTAFWGSADTLTLDFEDAKALQQDIAELVKKYKLKDSSRGVKYFLTLGFTPIYFDEDI